MVTGENQSESEADPGRRQEVLSLLERADLPVLPEGARRQAQGLAQRLVGLEDARASGATDAASGGDAPLTPGASLGPWEVVRAVGAGGQGRVYEVRHRHLGRRAAAKVPRREVAHRLLKEARLAARIEDERIVRVLDVAPEASPPFLVLEWCPGGSLADRLARDGAQGLPLPVVAEIAADTLRALAAAHRQGVVHCDVKPANLLFDERGRALLADLGIGRVPLEEAQRLSNTAAASVAGTVAHGAGTPLYLAPEQERPEVLAGSPIDGRADLFAFGKVLFEMLTGASPRTIRPPSRLRPGLDARWDDLVFRCLEERREARYPSAEAVLAALEEVAGALKPAGPRPPESAEVTQPLPRKVVPANVPAGVSFVATDAGRALERAFSSVQVLPPAPAGLDAPLPHGADALSPSRAFTLALALTLVTGLGGAAMLAWDIDPGDAVRQAPWSVGLLRASAVGFVGAFVSSRLVSRPSRGSAISGGALLGLALAAMASYAIKEPWFWWLRDQVGTDHFAQSAGGWQIRSLHPLHRWWNTVALGGVVLYALGTAGAITKQRPRHLPAEPAQPASPEGRRAYRWAHFGTFIVLMLGLVGLFIAMDEPLFPWLGCGILGVSCAASLGAISASTVAGPRGGWAPVLGVLTGIGLLGAVIGVGVHGPLMGPGRSWAELTREEVRYVGYGAGLGGGLLWGLATLVAAFGWRPGGTAGTGSGPGAAAPAGSSGQDSAKAVGPADAAPGARGGAGGASVEKAAGSELREGVPAGAEAGTDSGTRSGTGGGAGGPSKWGIVGRIAAIVGGVLAFGGAVTGIVALMTLLAFVAACSSMLRSCESGTFRAGPLSGSVHGHGSFTGPSSDGTLYFVLFGALAALGLAAFVWGIVGLVARLLRRRREREGT